MALANPLIFFYYLSSLAICCFIIPSESIGFSLPLIQTNFSLKSPLHPNDLRLRSPVHQAFAQYYAVKIQIGTPPTEQTLLLDTGSNLLWTQCQPCTECFDQGKIPFFHPAFSESFSQLPCGQGCETASSVFKCRDGKSCVYEISYGDGHSTSRGVVLNESLTFEGPTPNSPPVVVPDITFGCGMHNEGDFVFKGHDISGIMGLSMEPNSFVSQLSDQIQGRFSHCLAYKEDGAEITPTSLLKFGEEATLPPSRRDDIKTIDILPGPDNTFFHYYVNLVRISVGSVMVKNIPADAFKFRAGGVGGCIFDSGANSLTLEDAPFEAVMEVFDTQLRNLGLRRTRSITLFEFCYETNNSDLERYPTMTLHFGTVEYNIKQTYLYYQGKYIRLLCVMLFRSNVPLNTIGARQMQEMRILYDIKNKNIQFMPDKCAV